MQAILEALGELDQLYHSVSLAEYEQTWQIVEQQIRQTLPGFNIAYAEIYTAGSEREPLGSMRHILLPTERNAL